MSEPCRFQDDCPVLKKETVFVTINGYLTGEQCNLCEFQEVEKTEYPCAECRNNYETKYKGNIQKIFKMITENDL